MASLRALRWSLAALAISALPAAAQSGSFGNTVVIDGDALIVAEPNNTFRPGMVYLYQKSGDDWVEA